MRITIDHQWRVRAAHTIDLPMPANAVWGQMRDVSRFVTRDPLHRAVRIKNQPCNDYFPVGTELVLEHRLLGIGPDRRSRVLRWREGRGYVISDLSMRGPREAFPHVCMYEVIARDQQRSQIRLGVRGRWTATWVPRAFVRLWLWWVLAATGAHIRWELLRYCVAVRVGTGR